MIRLLPLLALMSAALVSNGQDISITFTGKSAATQIDSVKATNLATSQSVTLPGSATLILTPKTGIPAFAENAAHGTIFPNPFSGTTTLIAGLIESQPVDLKVQNLAGQVITQTETFLNPGDHRFDLSVTAPGIYLVSLTTVQGTTGFKVICTGSSGSGNSIQYAGALPCRIDPGFKSGLTGYTLGYSSGETIEYRCKSGNFTTIFTDSPMESKNYAVEFAPVARFTINPTGGTTETKFELDGSSSSDAETPADDLEVRWDFDGDGNWDTDYDISKTALIQFPAIGPATIIMEVKDSGGLTDTTGQTLNISYPTFTDPRDGHIYPYKKIGTQTWMLENMAYLTAVSPSSIGSETSPYCYVHGYDGSSVTTAKGTSNYAAYGVLYNWTAAKTACPSGWHLPTDEEWKILERHLGMSESDINIIGERNSGTVGGQLKETGTIHWNSPNADASNKSGFNGLPGGDRSYDASGFDYLGRTTNIWSTSEYNASAAMCRDLYYYTGAVGRYYYYKSYGFSVRCIRD